MMKAEERETEPPWGEAPKLILASLAYVMGSCWLGLVVPLLGFGFGILDIALFPFIAWSELTIPSIIFLVGTLATGGIGVRARSRHSIAKSIAAAFGGTVILYLASSYVWFARDPPTTLFGAPLVEPFQDPVSFLTWAGGVILLGLPGILYASFLPARVAVALGSDRPDDGS